MRKTVYLGLCWMSPFPSLIIWLLNSVVILEEVLNYTENKTNGIKLHQHLHAMRSKLNHQYTFHSLSASQEFLIFY